MAQTAATKDDDLLIISDDNAADTQVDNASIEISLDDSTSNESIAEPVIDFWESTSSVSAEVENSEPEKASPAEGTTPVVEVASSTDTMETPSTEATETSSMDLGWTDFSLDMSSSESTNTEIVEEKAPTEPSGFDMWLGENTSETMSSDVEEVWGLNVILGDTITKLQARQEVIASDKATKTSRVSDIKSQIKELEEQVANLEAEMEGLDAEDKKITANVKSLEKMKLGDEAVTKAHNSKRVPKK